MAVALLQLAVSLFNLLTNLLTFAISQGAALLLGSFLQLKLSGDAAGAALEAFRGLVGAGAEYVVGILWGVLLWLATAAIQAVVGVATMLFDVATAASAELAEMARNGVESLFQVFRAVAEGSVEAAGEVVAGVVNNLVTAVGNVMETAASASAKSS